MQKLDIKNPAVQKMALAIVVSLAMLGVFFFSRVLPFTYPNLRDRVSGLKGEYEKKSTDLARARATVSDLPRFEAEYEHLHERWAMAAELLPADRQVAALLRKITLAAQQTGVEFLVFRPNDPKAEQHYTELPLQLSVYGGYHQVGSFIAELANMQRIITVSNLQLKSNTKDESGSATTSADFTASAYSLNESSGNPQSPAVRKEGEPRGHKAS